MRFTSPSLPPSMSYFEVFRRSPVSGNRVHRHGAFHTPIPLFFFCYCPFLKRSTFCISVKGSFGCFLLLSHQYSRRSKKEKERGTESDTAFRVSLPPHKSSAPSRKEIVQHLFKCTNMSICNIKHVNIFHKSPLSGSGVCPPRKKISPLQRCSTERKIKGSTPTSTTYHRTKAEKSTK